MPSVSDGPGLKNLRKLPALNYLSFQHVELTDKEVPHLAGLKELETLGLDDTKVTDAGIKALKDLPKLKVLWLTNTPVTNACVGDLVRHKHLTKLHLEGTHIDAEGEAAIKRALPKCQVVR